MHRDLQNAFAEDKIHTSHIRLFAVGAQFGLPILAIHNAFRLRSVGKLLIENPLQVELLQPGTQQPVIFLEDIETLLNVVLNLHSIKKFNNLFSI